MSTAREGAVLRGIGRRIQRLRVERGLTQQELAEAIGVQPETISRAETGASAMSVERLDHVARALRVSLAQLVDVAGDVLPPEEPTVSETELLRLHRQLDDAGRA